MSAGWRDLWDLDQLDLSESRFRALLDAEGSAASRAGALSQLARIEGLRERFAEGMDLVGEAATVGGAEGWVLIERGRLLRSGGEPEAALPFFEAAFAAAHEQGDGFLAGDAAHMAALVGDAEAWTARGLDYVRSSDDPAAVYWLGALLNNIGWTRYESGELTTPSEAAAGPRAVSEIRIYPVKSLAGVVVDAVEVEPWGLRHDRRWVVLDPDGDVVTAREEHDLLSLTALPEPDGSLVLQATDGAVLRVVPPADSVALQTSLSRVDHVHAAGSEADEWLSARLKRSLRLGWLDDPRRRTVSSTHGGQPGDSLSLADAGPLLLVTRRSLEQLNAWIAQGAAERREPAPAPIDALRFRPNVVVDGPDEPFSEDGWHAVRIGEVQFRFTEHCDRCVLTTIDPETCHAGKEPLRTLARHRQWDHKTWFGIRLVPETHGRIETGDLVTID